MINPNFEAPGAHPGIAQGWTLSEVVGGREIGAVLRSTVPYKLQLGFEDFAWFDLTSTADLEVGIDEGFDAWVTPYFREFDVSILATGLFDAGAADIDAFEWVTRVNDWVDVTEAAGTFDAGMSDHADFAWVTRLSDWSAITHTAATFDAGSLSAEGFEGTWTALT